MVDRIYIYIYPCIPCSVSFLGTGQPGEVGFVGVGPIHSDKTCGTVDLKSHGPETWTVARPGNDRFHVDRKPISLQPPNVDSG